MSEWADDGSVLLCWFELLSVENAQDADDDKRNRQQLSHIQRQVSLESFLDVLGVLDEEACCKHQGEAQSEVESAAHHVAMLAIDEIDDHEEAGVDR